MAVIVDPTSMVESGSVMLIVVTTGVTTGTTGTMGATVPPSELEPPHAEAERVAIRLRREWREGWTWAPIGKGP